MSAQRESPLVGKLSKEDLLKAGVVESLVTQKRAPQLVSSSDVDLVRCYVPPERVEDARQIVGLRYYSTANELIGIADTFVLTGEEADSIAMRRNETVRAAKGEEGTVLVVDFGSLSLEPGLQIERVLGDGIKYVGIQADIRSGREVNMILNGGVPLERLVKLGYHLHDIEVRANEEIFGGMV